MKRRRKKLSYWYWWRIEGFKLWTSTDKSDNKKRTFYLLLLFHFFPLNLFVCCFVHLTWWFCSPVFCTRYTSNCVGLSQMIEFYSVSFFFFLDGCHIFHRNYFWSNGWCVCPFAAYRSFSLLITQEKKVFVTFYQKTVQNLLFHHYISIWRKKFTNFSYFGVYWQFTSLYWLLQNWSYSFYLYVLQVFESHFGYFHQIFM